MERQLAFLAAISEDLSSSPDYETALERVARAAVPTLADACVIELFADGAPQQLAVAHVDANDEAVLLR
ncbi:MAG: hypothetical protein QOC97_1363, partial [Chloroflexota bacterium]|nr:hypothetical protein [Chloroflexota bacterium]